MRRIARRLLWALALALAAILVWRKVRIVVWVHASLWQLLLLFLGLAVGIYLVLELLLSRSDRD